MFKIRLDKSRYNPGDSAIITIQDLEVLNHTSISKGMLSVYNLGHKIDYLIVPIKQGDTKIHFHWSTPKKDFQGYMLEVKLLDESDNVIARENGALDVSSEWCKFPRYGYLTDFSSSVDTKEIIEEMKYWQLNAIEYYDWKFLHHQPLPSDCSMEWEDWAGRKIDGNIVKAYTYDAKENNMVSMSYNMIYAATNNYADYGIKEEWGLWHAIDLGEAAEKGARFTFHMGESPSGQSHLFFFDITNPEWQTFIIDKNIEAIKKMGFDGWHGDTVGEWGPMWTEETKGHEEEYIFVKEGYTDFLNAVKEQLGTEYYLSFNPVGAQGIEKVNIANVDVLYAEIWPWDKNDTGYQYDTYMSLKRVIDQSREESGGKSLIIPAYMEYTRSNNMTEPEPFNQSAVLLTDAAVYAAGGSRIELGDGHHMLSNEYFPKKNLFMSDEHKARQKKLQDFIVAYENLLRDGLEDNNKMIKIENHAVSYDGKENTVWAYAKGNESYEVIQLINLLGVSTSDWRSAEGVKEKPIKVRDITLKYYTDKQYKEAYVTSPDPDYQIESRPVAFEYKEDEKGDYLEFKIDSLEYWDMIYMRCE